MITKDELFDLAKSLQDDLSAEREARIAAEAKLARVKEWAEDFFYDIEDDAAFANIMGILSDSRPPLAVVEGMKAIDGETNNRQACIDAWLPGKVEDWPDDTYTLIVMPK